MNHPDETRLNDYVDGVLGPEPAAEVEAHLADCTGCRGRVATLRELADRLAALPEGIPPRRDLRPGIRERIEAGHTGEPGVTPRPAPVRGPENARPAGGRPWLRAAAAVAVLVGAGAAVWLGVDAPGRTGSAGAADPVIASYHEAARELTGELEARKTALSPAAVRALDASLAAVDAAIRELERARRQGAHGDALDRHLEGRYRTKLELLRGALAILEES